MTSPHQCFPNSCQCCSHPLLDRQPDDQETSATPTTAMRKPKKVKRFRLSQFTLPALLRSVSTKSNGNPHILRIPEQLGHAFHGKLDSKIEM